MSVVESTRPYSIVRVVHNWREMEQFGIDLLTGEACSFAMRGLIDVTAEGKSLVERFLGSQVTITPDSNWNRGSEANPHVGSVMLPYGILTELAAFCMCVTSRNSVASFDDGRVIEFYGEAPLYWRVKRYFRRLASEGTGDRNEHAMSGRVI